MHLILLIRVSSKYQPENKKILLYPLFWLSYYNLYLAISCFGVGVVRSVHQGWYFNLFYCYNKVI